MFICSTTWTTEFQNTRNLRTSSKTKRNKTDVQNLENILRMPFRLSWCFFHLDFFSNIRRFEKFWIAPKGPTFDLFRYFATEWMLKNLNGTVTLFKNIIFLTFFQKFLVSPKGYLHIFQILQQTGVSKSPKPPYTFTKILRFPSFRYGANFGCCSSTSELNNWSERQLSGNSWQNHSAWIYLVVYLVIKKWFPRETSKQDARTIFVYCLNKKFQKGIFRDKKRALKGLKTSTEKRPQSGRLCRAIAPTPKKESTPN